MKYTTLGRYRTTIDRRYTIIKDFNTNTYAIRDNIRREMVKYNCVSGLSIDMSFPTLKSAKAWIDKQYI